MSLFKRMNESEVKMFITTIGDRINDIDENGKAPPFIIKQMRLW